MPGIEPGAPVPKTGARPSSYIAMVVERRIELRISCAEACAFPLGYSTIWGAISGSNRHFVIHSHACRAATLIAPLAPEDGLEPPYSDPKSEVLPLDDSGNDSISGEFGGGYRLCPVTGVCKAPVMLISPIPLVKLDLQNSVVAAYAAGWNGAA